MHLKSFFSSGSKLFTAFLASAVLVAAVSCGKNNGSQLSELQTVDIPHTNAKWQSIGNCWIYAFTGWAESLVLESSKGTISLNISESHITYLHYRKQLLSPWIGAQLQTGGFFSEASSLIEENGFLFEGEFLPKEAEATFSKVQKAATDYLNNSMANGVLKTDKSETTVTAELNKAFGVNMEELKPLLKSTQAFQVSTSPAGEPVSFQQALDNWREVRFPRIFEKSENLPLWSGSFLPQQTDVLQRVKKALNDGHPVVMNWFVDFNALDNKGVFSHENLVAKGVSGKQGFHSTVLEDYGVSGIDPKTGAAFTIGEGEVSEKLQKLAEKFGNIDFIVVKNSWGGTERLDRPSYKVNGEGGYHKLTANYLFGTLARMSEDGTKKVGTETGVNSFILPRGY